MLAKFSAIQLIFLLVTVASSLPGSPSDAKPKKTVTTVGNAATKNIGQNKTPSEQNLTKPKVTPENTATSTNTKSNGSKNSDKNKNPSNQKPKKPVATVGNSTSSVSPNKKPPQEKGSAGNAGEKNGGGYNGAWNWVGYAGHEVSNRDGYRFYNPEGNRRERDGNKRVNEDDNNEDFVIRRKEEGGGWILFKLIRGVIAGLKAVFRNRGN